MPEAAADRASHMMSPQPSTLWVRLLPYNSPLQLPGRLGLASGVCHGEEFLCDASRLIVPSVMHARCMPLCQAVCFGVQGCASSWQTCTQRRKQAVRTSVRRSCIASWCTALMDAALRARPKRGARLKALRSDQKNEECKECQVRLKPGVGLQGCV
jgi:hypothetical protein